MALDDLEAVAAVHLESFPPDGKTTRESALVNLREELARPFARARVLEEDGAVAGFAVTWRVADELHLLNVAVRPSLRRRGLGERLMQDMLAHARAHDVRGVYLEVRRSNEPAIDLYRKLGFWASGLRAGYYSDGEDALCMSLTLDAQGLVLPHEDEVAL
jgi:ribosomal-protein-alanine N-acetyltransferase